MNAMWTITQTWWKQHGPNLSNMMKHNIEKPCQNEEHIGQTAQTCWNSVMPKWGNMADKQLKYDENNVDKLVKHDENNIKNHAQIRKHGGQTAGK